MNHSMMPETGFSREMQSFADTSSADRFHLQALIGLVMQAIRLDQSDRMQGAVLYISSEHLSSPPCHVSVVCKRHLRWRNGRLEIRNLPQWAACMTLRFPSSEWPARIIAIKSCMQEGSMRPCLKAWTYLPRSCTPQAV